MAEVLSKSSIFFPAISHQDHHSQLRDISIRFSIFMKTQGESAGFSSLRSRFNGLRIASVQNWSLWSHNKRDFQSIDAKVGLSIGKARRWWEKGLQPNMKEITSAEDLANSLLHAGDKLVVVDFFSPGCGGCKALHPKICQLAEMNPDVQFLQVNYEDHKSMCYSLNVHVLPFFRFYRGAEGRVCSFSCTNATIKKFKDALAKYGPDRCTLGPAKGLEEKELLALAANKDLSFTYTPMPVEVEPEPVYQEVSVTSDTKDVKELVTPSNSRSIGLPLTLESSQDSEERTLTTAGK